MSTSDQSPAEMSSARAERVRWLSAAAADNQRLVSNALAERDRAVRRADQLEEENRLLKEHIVRLTSQLEEERASSGAREPFSTLVPTRGGGVSSGGVSASSILRVEEVKSSRILPGGPSSAPAHREVPVGVQSPHTPTPRPLSKPSHQHSGPSTGQTPACPTSQQQKVSGGSTRSQPLVATSSGSRTKAAATPSTAIIPYKDEDQQIREYTADINNIYKLVEQWVDKYASGLNPLINDHNIETEAPDVWKFMLNIFAPRMQTEAQRLLLICLRDEDVRHRFIMRMIVELICNQIWNVSAWEDFDDDKKELLVFIRNSLNERGISNEQRANLVQRRTEVIQEIITHESFHAYRRVRLDQHSKALRKILGPLLNLDKIRAEAGRDMGPFVIQAFDFAAKIWTSGWMFLVTMPECGARFQHPQMAVLNSSTDPFELHMMQVRTKLVVTPTITIRDDNGTTVRAKTLTISNVIVVE